MKKLLFILISIFGFASVAWALPSYSQTQTMIPGQNNTYDIGTSTAVYRNFYVTNICLSADCKSAWPTGGGGGGSGSVGTSTVPTRGQLAEWSTSGATPELLTSIATTTLLGNNGLTSSAGIGYLVGGSNATIGLASIGAGSVLGTTISGVPTAQATSSLYAGTAGQVLGLLNGVWIGTATTTFNSPLTYSGGAVSCSTCLTGNQTITLSGAVTGSGATAITTAFGTLAQGVLGNPAPAATIPTALATSSLYFGTAGQTLSYLNGVWVGAATTTFTGTAPISLTYAAGQVTGACTNASSGVTGCLTGADWNTFNGKENVLTFSTPMIRSGNTINWVGLATTSQPTSSQLLVSNGAAGVFGVSTTSATCGSGVTCTAFNVLGSSNPSFALAALGSAGVLGAQTAVAPTVQATSTLYGTGVGGQVLGWNNTTGGLAFVATSSSGGGTPGGSTPQLQYNGSGSVFAGVSTSSPTFNGGLTTSGTAGAWVGGSAYTVSISAPVSIANGGTNNTGAYTAGSVIFSSGTALTQNNAKFFWDNTNNRLGIGTTTPWVPFQVASSSASATNFGQFVLTDTNATANLKHWLFSSMGGFLYIGTSTDLYATSTPPAVAISNGGNFGIGTTSPQANLAVNAASQATPYFAIGSTTSTVFQVAPNPTAIMGLGTSTPFATFSEVGVLGTIPLVISTTTSTSASTTLFMIDQAGDVHLGGGTPTLSGCGTGPVLDADSTDQAGTITVGGTGTGCTLTFAATKLKAPHCVVVPRTGSVVNAFSVTVMNTTTLTFTETGAGGNIYDYACFLGH